MAVSDKGSTLTHVRSPYLLPQEEYDVVFVKLVSENAAWLASQELECKVVALTSTHTRFPRGAFVRQWNIHGDNGVSRERMMEMHREVVDAIGKFVRFESSHL